MSETERLTEELKKLREEIEGLRTDRVLSPAIGYPVPYPVPYPVYPQPYEPYPYQPAWRWPYGGGLVYGTTTNASTHLA